MSNKNIAIIGAGITGLTAGYRLAKKGYEVTIYEKSNYVGGLASGFEINGTNLEKAYHHIFRTDTEIIKLVEEIGLKDNLEWLESSIGLYYEGKMYPFMTPGDLLAFKPLSLTNKVRQGLIKIYLEKTNNYEQFIDKPAWEWMKKQGGEEGYKVIWEPLLKGKFHEYYKDVSMAWLWARIHTRANSKEKGESKEKLGYFKGGFQIISTKLSEKIESKGGKIKLNTNVEKIKGKGDKVEIIIDGKSCVYDKVIASVPSGALARLIDQKEYEDYIKKLNSVKYLGALNVIFTSSQSLSRLYWHNINDTNSPFMAFIQHTNLTGTERYKGENVYYMGTYLPHNLKDFNSDDESVSRKFFDYLKKIFPEFDRKMVNSVSVFKFANAQHIVDLNYPNKIPEYETPINNLYLTNFSQIFPEDRGTNFAVREGEKIAKLIENGN